MMKFARVRLSPILRQSCERVQPRSFLSLIIIINMLMLAPMIVLHI
jgi:hypothetical protein